MTTWSRISEESGLHGVARSSDFGGAAELSVERSTVSESRDPVADFLQNLSGSHVSSSGNACANIKRSEQQQVPKESAESAQTPGIKVPAAVELLASWPKENINSGWVRCKGEILCVFGSFNLLLVFMVVGFLITGRHRFFFILPWLVTILGSIVLLGTLVLDFAGSQTMCFYTSPVLFLLAFLSWFVANVSCKSGAFGLSCRSEQGHSEAMGLLLSLGLPWLLTAAPIMTWQASCFLSLGIPSLFLSTLMLQNMAIESTSQIMAIFFIVVLCTATNVSLQYLRTRKVGRILGVTDAFRESKLRHEEALGDMDERESDDAHKISKMRQFISYIFHEIRVPFNAVVLGIGLLLACDVSDEMREILKMMDSSSASMIRILNDVLDMGKIESGKLHLEKQPFNMGEMVSSLIWAFKDTLDSKGLEFSLSIDQSTKEFLSNHDLLGDKHRVHQVLANYLSNAAKFTPRGGKVSLRVVCDGIFTVDSSTGEAERPGFSEWQGSTQEGSGKLNGLSLGDSLPKKSTQTVARITISVEDTGIGISKEDQAALFEPYKQISAGSSQGGGGTGLGLCFAKRIVELAGGKIGVFSEVGKGSIFLFTMPFQLVESSKKDKDAEAMHTHSDTQRHTSGSLLNCSSLPDHLQHNPRVLIVEDNLLNRKILKKLLESFNVESDDAENGKQAVELVREGSTYDMILIDKEMPVMDGHEATRELRAMGVKSPIVGLTGNALDSDRNQFLAAGVDDFFTKPISRHQLLKLLEVHGLVVQKKDKDALSSISLPNTLDSRLCLEDGRRFVNKMVVNDTDGCLILDQD